MLSMAMALEVVQTMPGDGDVLGDQVAPNPGRLLVCTKLLYLSPDVRQDRQCLFKSARELPPEGLSVLCCASLDFSLCPGALGVGMF